MKGKVKERNINIVEIDDQLKTLKKLRQKTRFLNSFLDDNLPERSRNLIYDRLGQSYEDHGDYSKAVKAFSKGGYSQKRYAAHLLSTKLGKHKSAAFYSERIDGGGSTMTLSESAGYRDKGFRESDSPRFKKSLLEKLSKKQYGIISLIGILGSLFFLSPNLTGNAISNFNRLNSNLFGGVLFVLGLVGIYFWKKK